MPLIDRTAYPRFPDIFTTKELATYYTPTDDEYLFACRTVRGDSAVLNLLAMLKVFQRLHYFPHPVEIPLAVLTQIHSWLKLENLAPTDHPRRSLYRQRQNILEYLGVAAYGKTARHKLVEGVFEAARTREDLADLINVGIETLSAAGFELPSFEVLEKVVRKARYRINSGYFSQVEASLTDEEKLSLAKLLVVTRPTQRFSLFNRLKEPPKSATLTHLKDLQNQLDWLEGLGRAEEWLKEIPRPKITTFAAQARALDASDLGDYLPARRYTLLASLIFQARLTTRNNLVEMLLKRMATMHSRGKEELELLHDRQQELNENLVATLAEIAELARGWSVKSLAPEEEGADENADDEEDWEEEEVPVGQAQTGAEAEGSKFEGGTELPAEIRVTCTLVQKTTLSYSQASSSSRFEAET